MSTIQNWNAETKRIDRQLGDPPELTFPDDWTLSTSWQRAQSERDRGGPINDAERMVYLSESSKPHRVVFVLDGATLRAECSCKGWHHRRDVCAHVASCWWQWTNGEIVVSHLETGRKYQVPPSWLRFEIDELPESLSPAELDAYLHCELGDVGPTQWAEFTGRSKGTVGNLLSRARNKVSGGFDP
jgi:hypothetical protein